MSVYLGTSTWSFPGWTGIVYSGHFTETYLSQKGLIEYAKHPLLNAVGVDRTFYRPMTEEQFRELALQVNTNFRFLVKAYSQVSDAHLRATSGTPSGAPLADNPDFLNPQLALETSIKPARQGLGTLLGTVVFQLSPIHRRITQNPSELYAKVDRFLAELGKESHADGKSQISLELRNPELLTPRLLKILAKHETPLCLALHEHMPALDRQLRALEYLRSIWPRISEPCPLYVRWTLQSGLGGYNRAKQNFAPFDKLAAPDLPTRAGLAHAIAQSKALGATSLVIINNKAEGSAPLSVTALSEAVMQASQRNSAET